MTFPNMELCVDVETLIAAVVPLSAYVLDPQGYWIKYIIRSWKKMIEKGEWKRVKK